MKKKLIFKYFIFIFLFSFNQVIAEECDLEFEIGDDASKAIFLYGEPQDESDGKVKVDTGYTFIEEFFKFVCPGHGMEEAIIQILLSNDEISGYKINSYARKDDEDAKNILIYYYIKENFLNVEKVKDLTNPDWTGNIYWETNNIYYYYYKFLNQKTSIVTEELFVTKERFGKYFN